MPYASKEDQREYQRRWYQTHKEEVRTRLQQWRRERMTELLEDDGLVTKFTCRLGNDETGLLKDLLGG